MSEERTKLLKKAVLTGVGASTSAERIKQALNEAAEDLYKVGQELLGDLERQGKVKADSMQNFLKNLQDETGKRKSSLEQNLHVQVRKTAREMGFVLKEDLDELHDRVSALEDEDGAQEPGETKKSGKNARSKRS